MSHVNCHQKQVIHRLLLQDCRNLHMAGAMHFDAGGTFLTRHCVTLAWFPHELIDAVTYCILCSRASALGNTGHKVPSHSRKVQKTPSLNHVIDRKGSCIWKKSWIPQLEVQLQENPWQESSIKLWLIFFGTGGNEMEQRVVTRLRKISQVGSEEWNNVAFIQRTNSLDTRFPKRAVHWSQSEQGRWWIGGNPTGTTHAGRPPWHSFNAHNVQLPTGTD